MAAFPLQLYGCRYSDKYSFRDRSETTDLALTLSLQPWEAFQPDGVIMFSDILTPLPALGIEFDVIKGRGPRIETPIRRSAPDNELYLRNLAQTSSVFLHTSASEENTNWCRIC